MNARLLARASALLLAVLLPLAADASAQIQPGGGGPSWSGQLLPPGGGQRAKRVPLPPTDPTIDQEWPCFYWGYYVWSGVEGRIYWPNDCGSTQSPPGVHPMVLLVHGDGHSYTDYGYLMRHLALNGFIAATISAQGSNDARATKALTYIDFMRNHWSMRNHVADELGLIGHSRGGEAVLTVARYVWEQGLGIDVGAVISLAPTDNDEGGVGVFESLSGLHSHAYLAIYGTHDEDVAGYCASGTAPWCGNPLPGPNGNAFTLYDRAGSEGGTEPLPWAQDVVTKSLLFIEGANHNSWREPCDEDDFPLSENLHCLVHQDMAKGYMNAFLRWHLYDQPIYKYYFTGDWIPASFPQVHVRTQYQEGYGRRVVDNFEFGGWGTNSLGGSVWTENTVNVIKEGSTWDYDATIPGMSDCLIFTWAPPGLVPWMRWDVPDGQTQPGRRWRDVRDYDYLSFRAGQVYGSSFNTPGESKDFYVQLLDSGGNESGWVRVAKYADLDYPTEATLMLNDTYLAVTVSSTLQTVRMPLCAFEGVDLENVSAIRFFFNRPGSTSGELVLDNLEFTD